MNKKISGFTLLGYLAGFFYGLMNIWHYYIQYPDISEFIGNMGIAVLIIGISWAYNKILKLESGLDDLEKIQFELEGFVNDLIEDGKKGKLE